MPNYAVDLPMKEHDDPLPLEVAARQLSQLGGWPARRRGYAMSPRSENGGAYTITTLAFDAETPIGAE